MSAIYGNWERLVRATLLREELRLTALRTPSDLSLASSSPSLSASSSFNFIPPSNQVSSFNFSNLSLVGDSFTYHQILQATDNLSSSNLIKNARSGDYFYGVLEGGTQVVVKEVDTSSAEKESFFMSELEFFAKVSHPNFVPLLGHCFENWGHKFLVYKYMPNKDFSSSFYKKTNSPDGPSTLLDWKMRYKVAIGVAQALYHLHHQCVPPLVHRNVEASSILIDENYDVHLGSVVEVCTEKKKDRNQSRISWLLRLPKSSERDTADESNATCAYDVYCFGKVLLELLTGNSVSSDQAMNRVESILTYITYDKELFVNIMDPCLTMDERLLDEAWTVAVVAKACLSPKSSKRPLMKNVLEALKDRIELSTYVGSPSSGQLTAVAAVAAALAWLKIPVGFKVDKFKLLNEDSSVDVQIAAATALVHIANNEEGVGVIVKADGVSIIIGALRNSPMKVQIKMANLVARMAEHSPLAKEEFGMSDVISPMVTLLSIDFMDELSYKVGRPSFDSIVEMSMEGNRNRSQSPGLVSSWDTSQSHSQGSVSSLAMQSLNGGRGLDVHRKEEREKNPPEVKLRLKISCAEALRMLARGNVLNSKRITDTKGLRCLVEIVEKEHGELLFISLMTVMEITSVAESNAKLRREAFKTNSRVAKAVVDQLLRIIKEYDDPKLQIPAIRAIGFLARTFPGRDTGVIGPLVAQLRHRNLDVAAEAAIALGKFACPENFLHVEHSKSIVEFQGVLPLLRLFKGNERAQVNAFVLLCYLVLHAENNELLQLPWVLTTLKGADSLIAQNHELAELRAAAIGHIFKPE